MIANWWVNLVITAMVVGVAILIALLLRALWRLLKRLCNMLIMLWTGLTVRVFSCLNALKQTSSIIEAAWFIFALRGRLTVRASTYLMVLSQTGATRYSANKLALSIDSFAATHLRNAAMYHVNEVFGGSRLSLISEARLQGFLG